MLCYAQDTKERGTTDQNHRFVVASPLNYYAIYGPPRLSLWTALQV